MAVKSVIDLALAHDYEVSEEVELPGSGQQVTGSRQSSDLYLDYSIADVRGWACDSFDFETVSATEYVVKISGTSNATTLY